MNIMISKIASALEPLKADKLKALSYLIGSQHGVTKTQRRLNILKQCKLLEPFRQKPTVVVTSIDSGVTNFAYCALVWHSNKLPELISWNKIQLENKFLQNESLSLLPSQTSSLVNQLTRFIKTDPLLAKSDIVTIERQRTRTTSSRFVTDPIIKVNILEHLLYLSLQRSDFNVVSSDPGKMTKFWISQDLATESNATSKRYRIDKVIDFLKDKSSLTFSKPYETKLNNYIIKTGKTKRFSIFDALQLQETVAGPRKDDDLADSLLHAMCWIHWLKNYRFLCDNIDSITNPS